MPSLVVPVDYANIRFRFDIVGKTDPGLITMGLHIPSSTDPNVICEEANDVLQTDVLGPLTMPGNWRFIGSQCDYNDGGTLMFGEHTASVAGSGDSYPTSNGCVLVKKITGLAGKKHRGRIYTYPCNEAGVDNTGLITDAYRTAAQTAWSNFLGDIQGGTAFDQLALLHMDSTAPDNVTSLQVE